MPDVLVLIGVCFIFASLGAILALGAIWSALGSIDHNDNGFEIPNEVRTTDYHWK